MVKEVKKVVWDEQASSQLKSLYEYIKSRLTSFRKKVRNDIIAITRKLPSQPENPHQPDKYKINNDGTFRAFENIVTGLLTG